MQRLHARGRRRIGFLAAAPGLTFYQHMTFGFADAARRFGLSDVLLRVVNLDSPLEEIRR